MTYVLTRTPFRLSFFGGGSDYPAWYLEHGGAVMSTAIDRYCYLTVRDYPNLYNLAYRVVWRHIENVGSSAEILHPAVRGAVRKLRRDDEGPLEIHHQSDLPARSGIGSSSSFSVGLLLALRALRGDRPDAHALALEAIDLERIELGETVGSQDQMAAAHGGVNVFRFNTDGSIVRESLDLSASVEAALRDHLVMVFTGRRQPASLLADKIVRELPEKARAIARMTEMVNEATPLMREGRLDAVGELLHESWMLKRSLTCAVAGPRIDDIYARARRAGAYGGKLMGVGGAGFMMFLVPPERHAELELAVSPHPMISVGPDHEGATVLFRG